MDRLYTHGKTETNNAVQDLKRQTLYVMAILGNLYFTLEDNHCIQIYSTIVTNNCTVLA